MRPKPENLISNIITSRDISLTLKRPSIRHDVGDGAASGKISTVHRIKESGVVASPTKYKRLSTDCINTFLLSPVAGNGGGVSAAHPLALPPMTGFESAQFLGGIVTQNMPAGIS